MNTQPGLIGRKIGMTQLFTPEGEMVGVTVVEVGPNFVIRQKTADGKDKYTAVQLGFGHQKKQRLTKPELGHLEKYGAPPLKVIREIRVDKESLSLYPPGQEVKLEAFFSQNERVDVTATSKGRGFAGVMKRHHFRGFEMSHGTHEFFRHGGSIGTRLTPGMTFKGKRMPGHMGNERVTVQNLRVMKVDTERNLLFVNGSVPGPNGGVVIVRKTVRVLKPRKLKL